MKKSLLAIGVLCFLMSAPVLSQEKHGELYLSQPEELADSVKNAERPVLFIVSEVPDLEFESTRQIFETTRLGAGEWQLAIEPGRQIFTIRARGYLPAKTDVMFLKANRAYRLKVSEVRPLPGALLIKTVPDSANLHFNGALLDAKTPYRFEEIPPGRYYVQVTKEGYHPVEKALVVESNQVTEWETELTQTAVRVQIKIEDKVQDAGIFINGEAKGMAPGVIFLEPGSYKLMLKKDGYANLEKVIEIPPDSSAIQFAAKLESAKTPIEKIGKGLSRIIFASLLAGVIIVVVAVVSIAALF